MAKVFLVIIAASLIQWIGGAPAPQLRLQQQLVFNGPPVNPRPVGNFEDLTDRTRKTITSRIDYHASNPGNSPLSHPVHPRLAKPLVEPPLLKRSRRALPYASFHCQEQVSSTETDPLVYRNHRTTSNPRTMNCSLLLPYIPDAELQPSQTSESPGSEKIPQDLGKHSKTYQLTSGSETFLQTANKNLPVNLIINLILPSSEDPISTTAPSSRGTSLIRSRPINQRRKNVTLHTNKLLEESKLPAASSLSLAQRNSTGRRFLASTQTLTNNPRAVVTETVRNRNISRFREYAGITHGQGTSLAVQAADSGSTYHVGHGTNTAKGRERENSSEALSPNVTRAAKREQAENVGETSQASYASKIRTGNQVTTTLSPRTKRTKSTTTATMTTTTTTTTTSPELELANKNKESEDESEDDKGEASKEDEVTENSDQVAIRRFHETYKKAYREVESFIDEQRPLEKDMFESEEEDNDKTE